MTLEANKSLNEVSYAVEHPIDSKTLKQGMSVRVNQRFRLAIKALGLDAPHMHIWVEDLIPAIDASDARSMAEEGQSPSMEVLREKHLHCMECDNVSCRKKDPRVEDPFMLILEPPESGAIQPYDI